MSSQHIGLVGLRRPALYRAWLRAGVRVVGWDADPTRTRAAAQAGVHLLPSIVAVARAVAAPRVVWLDVAPGRTTEIAMQDAWPELARGELIVDGGDSDYRDAPRREAALAAAGVGFADAGVHGDAASTTAAGAVTLGGAPETAARLASLLAPLGAWLHCGPAGAGHFVRMVRASLDTATHAAQSEALALLHASRRVVSETAAVAAMWRAQWPAVRNEGPDTVGAGAVAAAMEAGVATPVLSLATLLAQRGSAGASAARAGGEDGSS